MHYLIGLKEEEQKLPKKTTFRKQHSDSKLFIKCYTFKFIFIANNSGISVMHVLSLLFLPFYVILKMECLAYVFCATPLDFGMDRPTGPFEHRRWNPLWQKSTHKNLVIYVEYLQLGCPKAKFYIFPNSCYNPKVTRSLVTSSGF